MQAHAASSLSPIPYPLSPIPYRQLQEADRDEARARGADRMSATSALISGVKPSRIIAHSRIGRVLCVPVTSSVIRVSSKDSAKARIARRADCREQVRREHVAEGLPPARAEIEEASTRLALQRLQAGQHVR